MKTLKELAQKQAELHEEIVKIMEASSYSYAVEQASYRAQEAQMWLQVATQLAVEN